MQSRLVVNGTKGPLENRLSPPLAISEGPRVADDQTNAPINERSASDLDKTVQNLDQSRDESGFQQLFGPFVAMPGHAVEVPGNTEEMREPLDVLAEPLQFCQDLLTDPFDPRVRLYPISLGIDNKMIT